MADLLNSTAMRTDDWGVRKPKTPLLREERPLADFAAMPVSRERNRVLAPAQLPARTALSAEARS